LVDIASVEIAIGKIPKGKVSIDCIGIRGFESPTLDHWPREVAKSDPPSVKRGSGEEFDVGANFPIGK
jgi:hypothetical protein